MRSLLKDIPKGMTRNSAGGASFAVDDWSRLDRFIIFGSEGGSYYASERELTTQNCAAVMRCLAVDGPRAVERIAQLSESGRAAKNDPAIFALALASNVASAKTAAMAAFPRVCRTGSHLLTLVKMLKGYPGWTRFATRHRRLVRVASTFRASLSAFEVSAAGTVEPPRCPAFEPCRSTLPATPSSLSLRRRSLACSPRGQARREPDLLSRDLIST